MDRPEDADRLPVRVQLLGPVRAFVLNEPIELRGARLMRLLAALALEVGRPVSVDFLVDAVWLRDPPMTARRQIQDLAARLRHSMAVEGWPAAITRTATGYRLMADVVSVDADEFEARAGRVRLPSPREGSGLVTTELRRALDLWHGDALADIDGSALDGSRLRLDESRLLAFERYAELQLSLGASREVLGELTSFVHAHPLRESLVRLHMECLYRAGRAPEAMDAYHQLRARLADEFGIGPTRAVEETYLTVLRDDDMSGPSLISPADETPAEITQLYEQIVSFCAAVIGEAPPSRVLAPDLLPPDPTHFVGRTDVLADLSASVLGGTPVVLSGIAGVGKTAAAIRWSRENAGRFPDGQLFVDLHGHSDREPVTIMKAIAQIMPALGVPPEDLPNDETAALALYRDKGAKRALLLVLDNAGSPDQVRPLLLTGPGKGIIITSRQRMTGLVASNGARTIALDPLTDADASTLLARLLPKRPAEPAAYAETARLCGHLPLALRVAAAHLCTDPGLTVDDLNRRLIDDRINALAIPNDPDTAIGLLLDRSLAAFDAADRRLLLDLAAGPSRDYTATTIKALYGDVVQSLSRIVEAHMLEVDSHGRYTFHDLVRQHLVSSDGLGQTELRDR
jgi:DNA-binding SARP family transcriptional activator